MIRLLTSAVASAALVAAPVAAQTPTLARNAPPLAAALGEPVAKTWAVWQDQQTRALLKLKPPIVIPPVVLDPIDPAQIVPIPDNFDPVSEKLLRTDTVSGASGEGQGAFRFVCWPTNYNYDDSITNPGVIGGAMHGHENFGNTLANGKSTYASLRTTGESTCMNKLNRGHYWQPWMQNAAGEIIRSKQIQLYYKRWPASDPQCFVKAKKGCVDLPNGFRAISGYDPAKLGQPQPDNQVGTWWRCGGQEGTDQIGDHRRTIAEALSDCNVIKYGKVQIINTVVFGDCWNGKLDSPDHRSHITFGKWNDRGQVVCPATHEYVIPTLTQQIIYEVLSSDKGLRLSCDVMGGISVKGGVCSHADYREAWSPKFLKKIHDICINQLRDCSFGSFGDGQYMQMQPDPNVGLPRVISAPTRPAT